jgi:hypothetical protein
MRSVPRTAPSGRTQPDLYPHCTVVDFDWLAQGAGKSCARDAHPDQSLAPGHGRPAGQRGLCRAGFRTRGPSHRRAAGRGTGHRRQNDPVPKYLAALERQSAVMAFDRGEFLALVERLFDDPVRGPGLAHEGADVQCIVAASASRRGLRQGGTYDELSALRPLETLVCECPEANPVPALDSARTSTTVASVRRLALHVPDRIACHRSARPSPRPARCSRSGRPPTCRSTCRPPACGRAWTRCLRSSTTPTPC